MFPAEGPSFFLRQEDIPDALAEALVSITDEGLLLAGEDAESVDHARQIYAAERDAMAYLARSEHTRQRLAIKLRKKFHGEQSIQHALDRLESSGYLNDRRFADVWLRSRSGRRAEGQGRLLAGLIERGVSGAVAREALAELFTHTDERELCRKAIEKFERTGKTGDKLTFALLRKGFSLTMIRSCMKTGID